MAGTNPKLNSSRPEDSKLQFTRKVKENPSRVMRLYTPLQLHRYCHVPKLPVKLLGRSNSSSPFLSRPSPSRPPLNILYFGSDHFSGQVFKKLHDLHKSDPQLIQNLEVVTRCDMPKGHRLRLAPCPMKVEAQQLGVKIHEIPKREDGDIKAWAKEPMPLTPDAQSFNLAIAVSFGLLIPNEVLAQLRWGGTNIHPSLLPMYRGPAPIHHALMNGDVYTGVTIQTLDPKEFDNGRILEQERVDIPQDATLENLKNMLAEKSGNMLVDFVRKRWGSEMVDGNPLASLTSVTSYPKIYAPKVAKDALRVNWKEWSGRKVMQWNKAFTGQLWTTLHVNDQYKRVLLTFSQSGHSFKDEDLPEELKQAEPGTLIVVGPSGGERFAAVVCADDSIATLTSVKVEGKRNVDAVAWYDKVDGKVVFE
ncbi:hypothetical protein G7K_2738-t1 [Saitoella complicata NRRL Y-17804]|uniref:methionyl-tRNA formyltransferase n=2 Tax=Saitoella complicata (strain BCRC 22490 / CBS 7301 / JCM 7358 / NBRC 10748 / NRRL Y-17804) TaxID=698492 RepID=A0A0E9NGN2_SAICN|nr:hypothetical protein G7K_2738-t1 [Saitoella complicata NRRL Y-17804]